MKSFERELARMLVARRMFAVLRGAGGAKQRDARDDMRNEDEERSPEEGQLRAAAIRGVELFHSGSGPIPWRAGGTAAGQRGCTWGHVFEQRYVYIVGALARGRERNDPKSCPAISMFLLDMANSFSD